MGQMRSPVSWDRDSREEQARWSDTIRDLWKTLKTMNTQTLSIFLLEKSCHSNFDTETGAGDLLHETGWMNQLRTLTTLRHLSVNMLIVAAAAAGWYTRSWGVECEIFESLEDRELPVVHADEGIFPNQSVNDLVEAVKTVMMKVAPASIRQGVEFQGPHGGITVHYTVRLTHWQTALVDLTGINRHYLWLALSSDGKKQIPDVCKVPEKSDNDRPVLRLRDQNTIRADLVQSLAPSGEPCDAWLTAQFNTS